MKNFEVNGCIFGNFLNLKKDFTIYHLDSGRYERIIESFLLYSRNAVKI